MSDTDNKDPKGNDFKDTVFLPKTDFPMRGGLPQKEPEILANWQDTDLYGQIRAQNKDKPKWVLHDGPAYANGNIHMGHAVNKILKDVTIKSYSMLGYDAPYIPGSDCHGLPIEWKVEEKYRDQGKTKDDIDPLDLRAECRIFAKEWSAIQGTQTQRLGVLGRWDDPYMTMANKSEGIIVREIHKFVKNGGLYKGSKPVMWSVVEQTALAEAEVEYKEHKSITIWVRFPVTTAGHPLLEGADVVIWTTTPWTIPSNKALAYGEHIEYGVYQWEGENGTEKIVLATTLADAVKESTKIEDWELLGTLKGTEIEGTICAHPLNGQGYDEPRPLLAADFVTADAGTGFVHIAPSHGEDDYFLYLEHFGAGDIPDNVADNGTYRDHVPLFSGLEVYTQKGEMGGGNFAVLKAMAEAGKLLAKGSVRHEYPHSWRSGAPLIYRTTPQWFISMGETPSITTKVINELEGLKSFENSREGATLYSTVDDSIEQHKDWAKEDDLKGGGSLRAKALREIAKTKWIPAKGEARIRSMVANRPDWCISRQRVWGVPIALFVNKETESILNDEAVLTRIGDIFEEEGADAWWARPASDFLGSDYNPDDYEQIFDTADVWFDSASTHAIVLEQEEGLHSPADLYLEGSDQHRGWFHSSLLESVGTRGHAPYKSVLTHGFVLDEKGYKMSKSKGNVVDPLKMMDQYGADILRLWAMTSDFSEDIRIGKDSLKNTGDLYRRIRNTLRFLLGALDGFTKDEMVEDFFEDPSEIPELEQLVLHQLYEMDKTVRGHIENYEFMKLTKALHDFCNENLSAFYFDIRKDSLYCDAPDNEQRRITRSVMAMIYNGLTAWLAPILAFTTEEAWSHRPQGVFEDAPSVHLREFPTTPESWHNPALAGKWFAIRELREKVTAAIEPLRADKTIGSSLEALPIITLDEGIVKATEGQNLPDIFITSGVRVEPGSETTVKIEKAPGEKCVRCWKTLPEVTENSDSLCNRCADVIANTPKEKAA